MYLKKGVCERNIERKLKEAALLQAANIDCLIARFCIETGLPAAEVEIVGQTIERGMKWFVRRKEAA
jgi:hypothetical protein